MDVIKEIKKLMLAPWAISDNNKMFIDVGLLNKTIARLEAAEKVVVAANVYLESGHLTPLYDEMKKYKDEL